MHKRFWLIVAVAALTVSCGKQSALEFRYLKDAEVRKAIENYTPVYPATEFAVFSDAHLYDTVLGTNGTAFETYLANDRKLLVFSEEIIDAALPDILNSGAKFVIVCGDLTKDGELIDHELFASKIARLEQAGIRVYVVPGNHDIRNPRSVNYHGPLTSPVPNISTNDFARIYADYGYNRAIERDPNSLSYVAEPVEGLWLLCLDSTINLTNDLLDESVTGGGFEQDTLNWIEDMLYKAVQANKAVIAVEHHGVNEHWDGQRKLHPEYLLNHYEDISKMFAAYKVRMVFTGHYHSQDVSYKNWGNGNFIFDIETGSLVTYPCPWRTVTIGSDQTMSVVSHFVTNIPSMPAGFVEYASNYVRNGIIGIAVGKIMHYGVDEGEARKVAPQVGDAYVAHYRGDENPGGRQIIDKSGLGFMGRLVINNQSYVIKGLWKDTPGSDNVIVIDLRTGAWH